MKHPDPTIAASELQIPIYKERAFLEITFNELPRWFELSEGELSLGRSEYNDIVLKDPAVAERHAVIRKTSDGHYEIMGIGIQAALRVLDQDQYTVILGEDTVVWVGQTALRLRTKHSSVEAPTQTHSQSFSIETAEALSDLSEAEMDLLVSDLNDEDTLGYQDLMEENDEDEDEDDHESSLPPTYSMKNLLVSSRGTYGPQSTLSWELIRFRGEEIFEIQSLKVGQTLKLASGFQVKLDKSLRCFMKHDKTLSFAVDAEVKNFQPLPSSQAKQKWLRAPGEVFAVALENGTTYLFRQVYSQQLILEKEAQKNYSLDMILGTSSTWVHLAIIVMMSIFSQSTSDPVVKPPVQEDVFATIEIKDLLKPEPTPEPKVVKPMDKPVQVAKLEKPKKLKPVNKPVENFKVQTALKTRAAEIPDVTQLGALGKLGGKGLFSKTASRSNMLVAAASNVSAIRAEGGVQTFSVSGNISALPGNEVRMARISTISKTGGTPQGDGFGSVTVGKRTGRKVQGLVVDASPPPVEVSVQGGLTRDEIAAVVQRHLSQIRYCYEKGLMDESDLSGKIGMKWTIAPTGDVSQAGIGSSTVRNAAVHSCLSGEVESWKFPRPRNNGIVVVSFPFVFNSATF